MRTVLIVLLTLLLLAGLALVFAGFHMARQQFRRRFQGGGDYFPYFSQLHPAGAGSRSPFPAVRVTLCAAFSSLTRSIPQKPFWWSITATA